MPVRQRMTDQIINVHGEERVVREDEAKRFRAVRWAIISIGAFVVLLLIGILLFSGIFTVADPNPGAANAPSSGVSNQPGP